MESGSLGRGRIGASAVPQAQGQNVTENWRKDFKDRGVERRIGVVAKDTTKQLVTGEPATLPGELLESILRTSYHKAQNGILPVRYIAAEPVMLYLLRKYVIGETLDAHIGKFFDF